MKRQLALVTVYFDTVGVLCKVQHIFTSAECADMLYVKGCCGVSATAAVEEYCRRFPILYTSLFIQIHIKNLTGLGLEILVASEWYCRDRSSD